MSRGNKPVLDYAGPAEQPRPSETIVAVFRVVVYSTLGLSGVPPILSRDAGGIVFGALIVLMGGILGSV